VSESEQEQDEESKPEQEETTQLAEEEKTELEEGEPEAEGPETAEAAEEEKRIEEKEEEEKPEKEKKEENIVEERFYTIPLRRAWIMPPKQRAPRAMRIIRSFVEKQMKIGVTKEAEEESEEEKEERLVISAELNQRIWLRGIEKPPRRIKVRVTKDSEGTVTVYPVKGD